MRPLSALLLILPIAMTAAADTNRGQPPATARPMMAKPLSVTQRQFARQFGQRLARNPDYQSVDADWRQFVRGQPRGTDFKVCLSSSARRPSTIGNGNCAPCKNKFRTGIAGGQP